MKWLLWMSVLFFLSCGKSFEKEAEQHLDKIIEDTAIDPGSIKLSDSDRFRLLLQYLDIGDYRYAG